MSNLDSILLGGEQINSGRRNFIKMILAGTAISILPACEYSRVPFDVNGTPSQQKILVGRNVLNENGSLRDRIVRDFSGLSADPNSEFKKIAGSEDEFEIYSSPLVQSGKITHETTRELLRRFSEILSLAKYSSLVAQDISRQNASSLITMGFDSKEKSIQRLDEDPESFNYSSSFGSALNNLSIFCENREDIISNIRASTKGLSNNLIKSDTVMRQYLTKALKLANLSESNLKGISLPLKISAGSNKSKGLFVQGCRMSEVARELNEVVLGKKGLNGSEGRNVVYDSFGESNFEKGISQMGDVMSSSRYDVVKQDFALRNFRYSVLKNLRTELTPWNNEEAYQKFIAAQHFVDSSISNVYSHNGNSKSKFNALNLILPLDSVRNLAESVGYLGIPKNIHDSVNGSILDAATEALSFETGHNNGDYLIGDGEKMKGQMFGDFVNVGLRVALIFLAANYGGRASNSSGGKISSGGLSGSGGSSGTYIPLGGLGGSQ